MPEYDFDLLTIGAGSGGVRAARLAGLAGKRSALVEEWTVGGTCVNRGCIPKKFYVYASHFADDFEDAAAYGWTTDGVRFDWPALVAAKKKELKRLGGIYEKNLAAADVELMRGRAVLEDPHTARIGNRTVTAETVLVATGARPYMPDIPGAEHIITSDEIFDLERLPGRMLIGGAGYIALEFACIMHGLGTDVTVVYRGDKVLRGFDEDVRDAVQAEMERKGIGFRFETVFERIERNGAVLRVATSQGDTIEADQVLMAAGRRPNTYEMGLEAAGVALAENGAVRVDELSRSTVPNIYAIGDCTDRRNLTPVAIHEAMCLFETLYGAGPRPPDHDNVASAVFTQPPVGTVGLTEAAARERYGEVDVYRSRFRPLKHTITGREEYATVKLVVARDSGRVVGVHMVGMDAAEIVQALAVAVKAGVTKEQWDATMAVHPTTAEEFVLMYNPAR